MPPRVKTKWDVQIPPRPILLGAFIHLGPQIWGDGGRIAFVETQNTGRYEAERKARLIVESVNGYDELRTRVRAIADTLDSAEVKDIRASLEDALAKAEEAGR